MPDDLSPRTQRNLVEERALAILALASAFAIFFIAMPIGTGLFLGALTAFTLLPWHEKLVARWHRRSLASAFCATISCILVLGTLTAIVVLIVLRATTLVESVQHASQQGGLFAKIDEGIAKPLAPLGFHPQSLTTHLQDAAESAATQGAKVAASVGVLTAKLILAVGFMITTIFYMLERWPAIVHGLEHLLPLKPEHTKSLLDSTRAIGRQVIIGTIGVGVTQGTLATIGYAICGAPDPLFFGAMTAVSSTIPGVGTLCIWVPLAIYLLATGHIVGGVGLLLFGALVVVSFCDGILRPKLVGVNANTGFFPTLIGLFGGIEIFGVMGLVIGPTVVGFSIAALRLYLKQRRNESLSNVDPAS